MTIQQKAQNACCGTEFKTIITVQSTFQRSIEKNGSIRHSTSDKGVEGVHQSCLRSP